MPLLKGRGIYTAFSHNKNNELKSIKLPLLLERVEVRRMKSSSYIPPSSQPSPSREKELILV